MQPGLEIGDEHRGVSRLADRGVVHIAVGVEIDRHILVGVAPPVRPGHVDLPPPERVSQRAQHTQLIRDPLDLAVLVDDCLTPLIRDDTDDRGTVAGWVEPLLPWRVDMALQQFQRVHHRPVDAVGAAELERVEDAGQHPPVVV